MLESPVPCDLGNGDPARSNVAHGPGWAYALAAPFRLMKGYQSQGGILAPLIVRLPRSAGRPVARVAAVTHVMDVMPTLLEAAGVAVPPSEKKAAPLPVQGRSLITVMKGGDPSPFQSRGFGGELFGICCYRLGSWKIFRAPPPYGSGEWQLYNLALDPGEARDLAVKEPDRLKHLVGAWKAYAERNGVVLPDELVLYAKPPQARSR